MRWCRPPGPAGCRPLGDYLPADYARLSDVAGLATAVAGAAGDGLDILVDNAARPGAATRTVTAEGNELTWQVDFLAPVALTALLADRLGVPPAARVVNVASATHLSATLDLDDIDLRHGYTAVAAYARAKLALVAYTCWLAGHLPHAGIEAVAVHPGVIGTGLLHAMFGGGGGSPERAARTLVEVVGREHDNGTYYDENPGRRPQPGGPRPRRAGPPVGAHRGPPGPRRHPDLTRADPPPTRRRLSVSVNSSREPTAGCRLA